MFRKLLFAMIAAAFCGAPVDAASPEETSFWRSIRNSENYQDYDEYLRRYPAGDYSAKARKRATRYRRLEDRIATEQSLGLSRNQRREVEERLARAGFYPGSINGAFNQDTRLAIRDFRVAYGLPRHRFLDRPMLRTLVRASGDEYRRGYTQRGNGREGDVAAGVFAGALLLGGVILLAD